MKLPRKKKCKGCKEYYRPEVDAKDYVKWCSDDCREVIALEALQKVRESRKRSQDKDHRERKRALKPISHWLNITQKVFNEYIRNRDSKEPCISCGRLDAPEWCAGHYRTRGAASHLRFNEKNVHKQCNRHCNMELSGNIANYRPRLIAKIGLEAVEALENDNTTKKWDYEELKQMREHYNKLIKEMV